MFTKEYARNYEVLNQNKNYKKEIEFIWEWAHKPNRILDIACGTAHYWKYYPPEVNLIGIDKSKDMIEMSAYKNRILNGDILSSMPIKTTFDLVTALFNAIEYMPSNDWWKTIPLKHDGYFVFDVWDKQKIAKEKFKPTIRSCNGLVRFITPVYQDENKVRLQIDLTSSTVCIREIHEMFLYDYGDIAEMAGNDFDIVDIAPTERWQTWFKLKKR